MSKIQVKNFEGKEVREMELDPTVFGVKVNSDLLRQAYQAISVNRMVSTAHTKTKGERRGSTRKPWKQKGTGRARTGSVRNPIWRKGGVTFGPRKEKNFEKKINKKMAISAIKMALSGKVVDKELIVVDEFFIKDGKTKEAAKGLRNLKLKGKTLMVFEEKEKDSSKASRNIPEIKNVMVDSLNVFDMLNNKNILISENGVNYLTKKYKA